MASRSGPLRRAISRYCSLSPDPLEKNRWKLSGIVEDLIQDHVQGHRPLVLTQNRSQVT